MDSLCAAISGDIGMPEGRVRKVLVALRRHCEGRGAEAGVSPEPGATGSVDPLLWYPLGANGRQRPPVPERP
jgi:hypothetical protein